MRLRRGILSLMKTRNLVTMTIVLIMVYELLLFKAYSTYTRASDRDLDDEDYDHLPDEIKKSSPTINLNRIIMSYLNQGDFFIPSSLKQIDWHNYTQIELEKLRVGIGEHGVEAFLTNQDESVIKQLIKADGYNTALGDKIPLNRSLPDIRHHRCKKRHYLESLPTVSVIVPFHNEHLSTLLRTAYSVLLRSPEELVKEIFLIDDASTKDFLKENLDSYVNEHMTKVKVVHLANRSGLIRARLVGAKMATADVLVFLDSHTEVNVNWLPPLLEPIALDYKTVLVPLIDEISYDTFAYKLRDGGARGSFEWGLIYMRISLLPKDKKRLPEPFETPVMSGGVFAIARHFFWELGGYDPGLDIWGGEQYELSFKIWQCGGRLLEVPCSHVGHIFRKMEHPIPVPGFGDYVTKNYRRVAEVWMDEYAEYLYAKRASARDVDPGDLTEQKALRQNLQCKPFRWFMTQIAFDLEQQFPPVDHKPYAEGRIRPKMSPNLCVDGNHGKMDDAVVLNACHPANKKICDAENDQKFELTWYNDVKLKSRQMCWDLSVAKPGNHIKLRPCHRLGGNQEWRYYEETKRFVFHVYKCLDHNPRNQDLFINYCDNRSQTQLWEIDVVNKEQLAKWNASNTLRVTGPVPERENEDRRSFSHAKSKRTPSIF